MWEYTYQNTPTYPLESIGLIDYILQALVQIIGT